MHSLTPQRPTLETAFLEITRDRVAYGAGPQTRAGTAGIAGLARELTTEMN